MRVEIDAGLYSSANFSSIMKLLHLFQDGRHEWALDPLDVESFMLFVESTHQRPVSDVFRRFAEGCSTVHLAYGQGTLTHLNSGNLSDAVEDLGRAAVLVLENNKADGFFIRAVATIFDEPDIIRAIDNKWLDLVNGGGASDACRQAGEKHESFGVIKRVLLLLDSDRLSPEAETKHVHRVRELENRGVEVHVLRLREAENYVPNAVLCDLKRMGSSSRRIEYLKRLTAKQRGYYDMKKGFKGPNGDTERRSDLFADLDERMLVGLTDGFGNQLLERFEKLAAGLSDEDVRKSAGPAACAELRAILDKIKRIV